MELAWHIRAIAYMLSRVKIARDHETRETLSLLTLLRAVCQLRENVTFNVTSSMFLRVSVQKIVLLILEPEVSKMFGSEVHARTLTSVPIFSDFGPNSELSVPTPQNLYKFIQITW